MAAQNRPRWLWFAPIIFTFLWAGGYGVAKVALQYAEPMTLLSLRYACVVLVMLPAYLLFKPTLPKEPLAWLHLCVVGVLIQAVYFGFAWWAFTTGISAGVLAIFMSLQPILVAILAPLLVNEKVSWLRWFGLLVALVGVLVVILSRSQIHPPSLRGIGLSTLGLFGITASVLYEKRFGVNHHPIVTNIAQYTAGFAVVLPIALLTESMHIQWTGSFILAVFYLIFGNSILAIGLLFTMVRAGEVSKISSLMFLVPPLAALFGWLLLDEVMPVIAWGGMAFTAFGVILVTRTQPS